MHEATYNKSGVDLSLLLQEVSDSTVSQSVTGSTCRGSQLSLCFDSPLSSADQNELDAIVAAHDGSSPAPLKIRDYCNDKTDVTKRSFTTGLSRRLYRRETFAQGELQKIEYCANWDGVDAFGEPLYSDVVVREDISYVRSSEGWASERTKTLTWIREDESDGPTKTMHKVYSSIESQREGKRRRGNIIDNLSVVVARLLVATETDPDPQDRIEKGRVFMATNKNDMDMFIIASKKDIVAAVQNATDAWLDNDVAPLGYPTGTTIRDIIIGEVDIWGIA